METKEANDLLKTIIKSNNFTKEELEQFIDKTPLENFLELYNLDARFFDIVFFSGKVNKYITKSLFKNLPKIIKEVVKKNDFKFLSKLLNRIKNTIVINLVLEEIKNNVIILNNISINEETLDYILNIKNNTINLIKLLNNNTKLQQMFLESNERIAKLLLDTNILGSRNFLFKLPKSLIKKIITSNIDINDILSNLNLNLLSESDFETIYKNYFENRFFRDNLLKFPPNIYRMEKEYIKSLMSNPNILNIIVEKNPNSILTLRYEEIKDIFEEIKPNLTKSLEHITVKDAKQFLDKIDPKLISKLKINNADNLKSILKNNLILYKLFKFKLNLKTIAEAVSKDSNNLSVLDIKELESLFKLKPFLILKLLEFKSTNTNLSLIDSTFWKNILNNLSEENIDDLENISKDLEKLKKLPLNLRKVLEKSFKLEDTLNIPNYDINLYSLYNHMKNKEMDSINIKELKNEGFFNYKNIVELYNKKQKNENLLMKDIKESMEKDLNISNIVENSKIYNIRWEGIQKIYKNVPNHIFLVALKNDSSFGTINYKENEQHPHITGHITVGWVRYTFLKDVTKNSEDKRIWIDEIQLDIHKTTNLKINTSKTLKDILKRFVIYMKSKGFSSILIPNIDNASTLYNRKNLYTPAYKDIPKALRFKLVEAEGIPNVRGKVWVFSKQKKSFEFDPVYHKNDILKYIIDSIIYRKIDIYSLNYKIHLEILNSKKLQQHLKDNLISDIQDPNFEINIKNNFYLYMFYEELLFKLRSNLNKKLVLKLIPIFKKSKRLINKFMSL